MRTFLICLLFVSFDTSAQSFISEIETFRNHYIAEHLEEERSPIKYQQVKDLDFFAPDTKYKVKATVEYINEFEGFSMLTHTGKKKVYYRYAKLTFTINKVEQHLYLYQSKRLMQKKEYRDYLFLPFTDATNYKTTFGGGRYIDFVLGDIKNNTLVLDFNKAYNPYCAYAGGFNCPIPPKENRLDIAIQAGEKLYKGEAEPH